MDDDEELPIWEVWVQMERFTFGWTDPRTVFSGGVAKPKIVKAPPKYFTTKNPTGKINNPSTVAVGLTMKEAHAMCRLLNAEGGYG